MERKDLYALRTWQAHQATQLSLLDSIGRNFKDMRRAMHNLAWQSRRALSG